jgi:hypothetical protein
MSKITFGFSCGAFSVALSGNNVVLPGSKNQPLKKSLIPSADMDDAAGLYRMRVTCEGSVVCDMPVHVVWVGHSSQREPFLGLKTEAPQELRTALNAYVGKAVELEFAPRGQ